MMYGRKRTLNTSRTISVDLLLAQGFQIAASLLYLWILWPQFLSCLKPEQLQESLYPNLPLSARQYLQQP